MSKFNLDAQEALQEIRSLIAEVNNLKTSMKNINQANKDSFTKLESGLDKVRKKTGLLANKMNHLEAILKQNTSTNTKNSNSINNNSKEVEKNAKSRKKQAKETDKATKAQKKNTAENKKSTKGFKSMSLGLGTLLKGFGVLAGINLFSQIAQDVFVNIKTFDSLNFAMEKITRTTQAYNESQKFLTQITRDYGVELVPTTNRWIKFLAAAQQSGLALKDTEDIFRSMTKASAVLGLNTEELTGVYLALEQMLSKGKVTTEELRRQLGERLPGAMGIMAASMGKTIPELDKMLKKGEVLSAEVLPDFARAVESAYGIENVDRVETLVAAQNRLTAAWQNFIKVISDDDSIIKSVLAGMLDGIAEFMNMVSFVVGGESERTLVTLVKFEKSWKQVFRNMAQSVIATHDDVDSYYSLLQQKIKDIRTELEEAESVGDTEKAGFLESLLNEELIKLNELDKKIQAQMKKFAKEKIAIYKDEADTIVDIRDRLREELAKGDFADQGEINALFTQASSSSLKEVEANALDAIAAYNVLRKLLTESNVQVLPGDDDGGGKAKKQRNLRDIRDLTLEIQREITRAAIQHNKAVLADEKTSTEERLEVIKKLNKNEIFLAQNAFKIKQRDLEASYKKEVESLEKSVTEGTLTRAKANAQILALENEKNQKIEIATINLQNKLNKIAETQGGRLRSVRTRAEDLEIKAVEDKYNRKIILLKQEYEASAKTYKDKETLERKLKELSIEMANEIIDSKIAILEALIAGKDATSEYVQAIVFEINKLKAAKKNIVPDDDDEKGWFNFWNNILEYAQEFTRAIGDIFDNVFERRIENINAEIEAERNKYDALIELAEGNEEHQKTLERNKQQRVEELERKRLKQQQKQARAKKAFAVAGIAIDTAQAIMSIWSDFPKYDFGVSAGLTAGLVAALGAAQIAAVLSAPIPQYKDGGNITKHEIAMINDGVFKEYVERDGNILTTERKNAIVKLRPNDIVYKNYEDMTKKSSVYNAMLGGTQISQYEFDSLFLGIENSIERGFKKAKINNNINFSQDRDNSSYKEELSRWTR